jgi:hypothetical protein
MSTTTTDVLARVADVIEPHMTGTFKRRQRVEGAAEDLARAGLLAGGNSPSVVTIVEQVAAVLQCRMDWPTAERIAAELAAAGLLKEV